jgi:hypothetical protein
VGAVSVGLAVGGALWYAARKRREQA